MIAFCRRMTDRIVKRINEKRQTIFYTEGDFQAMPIPETDFIININRSMLRLR